MDFNFNDVTSYTYNISVGLKGYTAYTGAQQDLFIGSGTGVGNLSPKTGYLGVIDQYDMDFTYTQPPFYGASVEYIFHGIIGRYASTLYLNIITKIIEDLDGQVIGSQKCSSKLPLVRITEKGGKPALEYGVGGAEVCNAVTELSIQGRNNVYERDAMFCDENSYINVYVY